MGSSYQHLHDEVLAGVFEGEGDNLMVIDSFLLYNSTGVPTNGREVPAIGEPKLAAEVLEQSVLHLPQQSKRRGLGVSTPDRLL